jgi:hypothetical protein
VFSIVSVKHRTVVGHLCFETLQLTACSGKPKTSVILSCERPTRTGSGEMARVVCTLMAKGWIGGVLYSGGAGPSHVLEDPSEG